MAIPQQVRPGDLITADFINTLLVELTALEARVDELESGTPGGGGDLVVTTLIPSGGTVDPIRLGAELRILGSNFRFSVGGHRVIFDNVQVTGFKPGSNDNLLVVDVPFLPGVPATGRSVVLRVENGLESVTRSITVRPPIIDIQGDVDVVFRDDILNPNPDPIVAGGLATFAYRIGSRANLSASFAVTVFNSRPELQSVLQITDSAGQPLPGGAVELAPGASRNILVRIPLPAGSTGQSFNMSVTAAAGDVVGSDARGFTIGTASEPSDPAINLSSPTFLAFDFNTGQPVSGASFNTSTNTITLPVNAQSEMEYVVSYDTPGTYIISATLPAGATGWVVNSNPDQHTNIQSGSAQFTLRPTTAAATTPTEVTFRIIRSGATVGQVRRYNVVRG